MLDDGYRTEDIKMEGDGCKLVGCKEMGDKVKEMVAKLSREKV